MSTPLIEDRGRGPEIAGTRITVYDLLTHFLDPTATETWIARFYELEPEQVAVARAYVLNNPALVLGNHLQIEEKRASGNPPEVVAQAELTRKTLLSFQEWLAQREENESQEHAMVGGPGTETRKKFPTFKEWLAERESRPVTEGS